MNRASRIEISSIFVLFLTLITIRLPVSGYQIAQDDGPSIELAFEEGAEILLAIYWDGVDYLVYHSKATVNDPVGVDVVIFRFHILGQSGWINQTADRIEGNSTYGVYEASLEGNETGAELKVWANNTAGNWTESGMIRFLVDPIGIDPKLLLLPVFLTSVIGFAYTRYRKSKRERTSRHRTE